MALGPEAFLSVSYYWVVVQGRGIIARRSGAAAVADTEEALNA